MSLCSLSVALGNQTSIYSFTAPCIDYIEGNTLPAESLLLDYIKGQERIILSPWFAVSTGQF